MKVAIHQANFIPWIRFFQKMAQSDIFVILNHVQFEKNGWQNRCQVNGKWWTNPIQHGKDPILYKHYTDGSRLVDVNMHWIYAIAMTLSIDTNKIKFDFETLKTGTDRLVEICQQYEATEYLTNMDALDKYLEPEKFERAGIKIVPFVSNETLHVFEAFDKYGIEGTRKLVHGKS